MTILITLITICIIYIVIYIIAEHNFKKSLTKQQQLENITSKYKYEKINFKSTDNINLYGELLIPASCEKIVIMVPGWGSNHEKFTTLADYLYTNNIASFKIDLRFQGNSEGKFLTGANLENRDVFGAINYLKTNQRTKNLKIITIGVSMGGATVINSYHKDITATIAIAPFSSFFTMIKYNNKEKGKLMQNIALILGYLYLPLKLKKLRLTQPITHIEQFSKTKFLLIHAKGDRVVPYSESINLATKLQNNKNFKFITLEGDNHTPWINKESQQLEQGVITDILNFIKIV